MKIGGRCFLSDRDSSRKSSIDKWGRRGTKPTITWYLSMRAIMRIFSRNITVGVFTCLTATFLLGQTGCASKNVNPASARAHTGYVDFLADADLYWQVEEVLSDDKVKTVFDEFKPLRTLRLAFAPGRHELSVVFLNRVIGKPGTVAVEVKDGMVTPVRVTLTEIGNTLVEERNVRARGTVYGRWGRGTRLSNSGATAYRIVLTPETALPYRQAEVAFATAKTNSPAK